MLDKFDKWMTEEAKNERYDFINKKIINIPIRNKDIIEYIGTGLFIGLIITIVFSLFIGTRVATLITDKMEYYMCSSLHTHDKIIEYKNNTCYFDGNGYVVKYRLYYDDVDLRYKLSKEID